MALALYHYNSSVCSEKVRMVLNEKGETGWESHEVDLFTGRQFDPAYLKLNPKAVVPTLVDDGRILTESTLIAEYLDDRFPSPPLKPADPFERAQMRLYSKMCDEGLHQGVAVLSYSAMFMDRLRKMSPAQVETHLSRIIDLERRDRQTAIYHEGVEAPHVYRGTVAFEKAFQKIDKTLSDGRTWLAGDLFTLAEINLAPYVARLEYLNMLDLWTSERPNVVAWFRRIQARPSYKAEVIDWMKPEELPEIYNAGTRNKGRIAEFRAHYLKNDFGAAVY
jgi:glutathione S-transferase